MLRLLDYFSTVDRNCDGVIDFEEALKHCFPYVPSQQLQHLQMWLHPQKFDPDLFDKLKKYAESCRGQHVHLTAARNNLNKLCEQLIVDEDRKRELQLVNKGYVSEKTIENLLAPLRLHSQESASSRPSQGDQKFDDQDSVSNLFTVTIFVISSAIIKLSMHSFHLAINRNPSISGSEVAAKQKNQNVLYRGMKSKVFDLGTSAFIDLAFFSASRSKKISKEYASEGASKMSTLLKIEAPLNGFADISRYSQ
jgi:hypothetical protein